MLGWLPENVSTYGARVDGVIRVIYFIVLPWFLLAEGVLLYFVFRYRRRAGVAAVYQPGTSLKSLAWILVPAVLILGFDLAIERVQGPVWDEIKLVLPQPGQIVRIRGRQFAWEFVQPGRDGILDTADDLSSLNILTVPVMTKVQFELEAADVIHSLWIPHLRLKQDAVPGRKIKGWFEVTKTGNYPIACAQLCGSGHGTMKGQLHVVSLSDYQKWLDEESPKTEVGSVAP